MFSVWSTLKFCCFVKKLMHFQVTIILLISLLLYYPVKDFYLMYIKGFPPGPISLPLIGSLHLMSPSTPHLSVGKLYKRYGSIVSLRMGPFGRAVFVSDLQLIDEVQHQLFFFSTVYFSIYRISNNKSPLPNSSYPLPKDL